MEVSPHLKKKAKSYNVSWQFLVMADLMAIGYGEADAYAIAFGENALLSSVINCRVTNIVANSEKFKKLLEKRKRMVSNKTSAVNEDGSIELIGAEETAREILKIAQTMPEGSKERGEMFLRYADLIRKNDTQTADDDNPVRIYLPMKCNMCPLKKAHDEKNKESVPVT